MDIKIINSKTIKDNPSFVKNLVKLYSNFLRAPVSESDIKRIIQGAGFIVAFEGKTPVGFVKYGSPKKADEVIQIFKVFTSHDEKGQNTAKELLKSLHEFAHNDGFKEVYHLEEKTSTKFKTLKPKPKHRLI